MNLVQTAVNQNSTVFSNITSMLSDLMTNDLAVAVLAVISILLIVKAAKYLLMVVGGGFSRSGKEEGLISSVEDYGEGEER